MKKVLITGAAGQIGTDLALDLARTPGTTLLLTDLRPQPTEVLEGLPYEQLDVMDYKAVEALIQSFKPDEIYHLAALLSGTAEKKPDLAWQLNVDAHKHLLDCCVRHIPNVKIFSPSSIAVFGPGAGKDAAQKAYLDPTSMYGVTKVAGEQLANYYHQRYKLDIRSLRFPGLISSAAHPGGGTTDYSVEVFFAALEGKSYTCYLKADTAMPFLYMPDAIAGVRKLMEAPAEALTVRTSYNLHGFSATPADFKAAVQEAVGHSMEVAYEPDFRQAIADSWPAMLEDEAARTDWGWKPTFGLKDVAKDMLAKLARQLHHA